MPKQPRFTLDDLDNMVMGMKAEPMPGEESPFLNRIRGVTGVGVGEKTPSIPKIPTSRLPAITRLPRIPRV